MEIVALVNRKISSFQDKRKVALENVKCQSARRQWKMSLYSMEKVSLENGKRHKGNGKCRSARWKKSLL
jgi:hypothetical protein